MQSSRIFTRLERAGSIVARSLIFLLLVEECAQAQRLLGIDISAFQNSISAANWTTLHTTNSRDFVIIRSSRGGTTGFDHLSTDNILSSPANCNGVSTTECLSNRYDDPYFGQNITRATNAGLFAGSYHRIQAQIISTTPNSNGIANSGADEANHMMQMAGAWMRPGYLLPMFDFEDGATERTDIEMAQFALDFSNRMYQVMQIRPTMYTNGNYAHNVLGGATVTQRDQIAQPATNSPSFNSPAFPFLVTARYPNGSGQQFTGNVQTANPSDSVATVYGIWDDYGDPQPWTIWQYSSGERLSGYANGTANIDADVLNGGLERLKDMLVPALWWNDTSGDWSTMTNWNSGRPLSTYDVTKTFDNQSQSAPYVPPVFPNMTPVQGSTTLPVPRLPGTAGSGPAVTSGVNDTVILERQNANITVTLSSGMYNIRKLYMRETLDISGGSLTINYDPTVDTTSTLISAQFSGAVTLSGSGSLSVNTLQVDPARTFTLAGNTGTLTFKTINLLASSKIAVTGDANINPLSDAMAKIANGGTTGSIDLSAGTRIFNVGNGTSDVDLDVAVPIINGGLIKAGAGTMRLSGNNTFAGAVTVDSGVLRYNHSSGLTTATAVTVNNGGTLDMNNITDTVASLASPAGHTTGAILQGTAGLSLAAGSGTSAFDGTITGTGSLFKSGAYTQILNGNNSLGAVTINAGALLLNGNNTTGSVSVSGGIFGGTGSVSGAVTIQSGAHLAPGASIESLGVGALTLSTGSILDFEVGPPSISDLVNVGGLLTLNGGSLNIVNTGGLSIGAYTLFTYGTLGGSRANLNLPTAPGNLDYSLLDTGSQIALVVSLLGDFNFDGIVSNADYVVWRKGLGTTYTQADYDIWRAHYGETPNAGPGVGVGSAVPEPAAFALLLLGCVGIMSMRQSRR